MFKCTVCGYIHEGEAAPDKCPKCNALQDKFAELTEEQAALVAKSRRTNDIHMELTALLIKVHELAQEGVDLNLDPPCHTLFTKTKQFSVEVRQSIKAEIQGHINKSKWG